MIHMWSVCAVCVTNAFGFVFLHTAPHVADTRSLSPNVDISFGAARSQKKGEASGAWGGNGAKCSSWQAHTMTTQGTPAWLHFACLDQQVQVSAGAG